MKLIGSKLPPTIEQDYGEQTSLLFSGSCFVLLQGWVTKLTIFNYESTHSCVMSRSEKGHKILSFRLSSITSGDRELRRAVLPQHHVLRPRPGALLAVVGAVVVARRARLLRLHSRHLPRRPQQVPLPRAAHRLPGALLRRRRRRPRHRLRARRRHRLQPLRLQQVRPSLFNLLINLYHNH